MLRICLFTALMAIGVCLNSSPLAHAQSILDLTYDGETGKLSSANAVQRLKIVSARGLFTGVPTVPTLDFYEHYVDIGLPQTEAWELGPVLEPGLTLTTLLDDLCINATHRPSPSLTLAYDAIRLNGEILPANPATCDRPPREFPPFSGEHSATLQYDELTGSLRVRSQSPLTTLLIESARGYFTGEPRTGIPTSGLDVTRANKLFRLWFGGFVEFDWGPVVEKGLENYEFVSDICVDGSWLSGGRIGDAVDYAYPGAGAVPVPPASPRATELRRRSICTTTTQMAKSQLTLPNSTYRRRRPGRLPPESRCS